VILVEAMLWPSSADFFVAVSPPKKRSPSSIVGKLRTTMEERVKIWNRNNRVHINRNQCVVTCLMIMKKQII